nr:hypothetical protein [uncultured Dongia sp.]
MCSKPFPTHEALPQEVTTLQEFEQDLDRLGGDLSRWPADKSHNAQKLLAGSPAARAALADAQLVDDFLASRPSMPSDNALAERIFALQRAADAEALSLPSSVGGRLAWSFGLRQAALYVAVGAIGLASGWLAMPAQPVYDVSGIFMLCADIFYL